MPRPEIAFERPQIALYKRRGGGFMAVHVVLNDQVDVRILVDRFDVGYSTGLMPLSWFWEQVDTSRQ